VAPSDDGTHAGIDRALRVWRQGDCVLGEQHFLFRIDTETPLTDEAAAAAKEGVDTAEAEVRGLMVATQTCDLVRRCGDRPFVEVCPLVEVDAGAMKWIRHGLRPGYAYVPGVAERQLVADLDRVMAVEKAVVAKWERIQGCQTDNDRRRLARALARKRARFAFPDDFIEVARGLVRSMSRKHDKDSDEGRALRALREVRVRAAPSWNAERVELTFWFIRGVDQATFEGRTWDQVLAAWLRLVPENGRFQSIDGLVMTLEDMTAREYVLSDPLDLDHLSP